MTRRYVLGKRRKPDQPQGPTPNRMAKGAGYMEIVPSADAGSFHFAANDSCLLDKLHHDGFFKDATDESAAMRRWDAGIRLKALHQAAGLAEPGAADLSRAPIGTAGKSEMSNSQSQAFMKYNRIMRAIGPVNRRICRDIACYEVLPKWADQRGVCAAFDKLFKVMG